jgi:ankyrin repeat protein
MSNPYICILENYINIYKNAFCNADSNYNNHLNDLIKKFTLDLCNELIGFDKLLSPLGESAYRLLYISICYGDLDLVRLLIEKGVIAKSNLFDIFDTPLVTAIMNKKYEIIKFLLEKQVSPNSCLSKDKFTPLHAACLNGDFVAIKLLLDVGANPKSIDIDRHKPMDYLKLNMRLFTKDEELLLTKLT